MPRIESRIEIGAPPATVFPWLVEPDRLARWISGFVGSEPIGSPEVRVGSRSRDIIDAEGRRIEVETEIVEVRPGERLAVRITSPAGGFDQSDSYDLSARDGGTERRQGPGDAEAGGRSRLGQSVSSAYVEPPGHG